MENRTNTKSAQWLCVEEKREKERKLGAFGKGRAQRFWDQEHLFFGARSGEGKSERNRGNEAWEFIIKRELKTPWPAGRRADEAERRHHASWGVSEGGSSKQRTGEQATGDGGRGLAQQGVV